MITLEIPELTPSLNELMRDLRNPHVRKAEQEKWDWLVAKAVKRKDKNAKLGQCKIKVSRCGPRPLDPDNLSAGFKFLFDALVHNNLIVDDNPSVITELTADQVKTPKKHAKMIVQITPIGLD